MTIEISVRRDGSDLEGTAALFFDTVKNERPAPGEDYPYIYVVEADGDLYLGFGTDLPESREPWTMADGEIEFHRDKVYRVGALGNLTTFTGPVQREVNAAIAGYRSA